MTGALRISIGQWSERGRKAHNQDFHGALIPREPLLSAKGITIAIADGISTSNVSAIASESAVKSLLTDYYCTSDSWSVKTSAQRVVAATNSWLHAQTCRSQHRYDADKGYVCTLSALILKSRTAHLFHVGDSRIYRVSGNALEQLTNDHRVIVSPEKSHLARALGAHHEIDIEYRTFQLQKGDVFLLATDGVYEYANPRMVVQAISNSPDLDAAARSIAEEAYASGSVDNLTIQIARIDDLPQGEAGEFIGQAAALELPPLLDARMTIDGYEIVREIHASSRSHIYLATDVQSGEHVALKIPSLDLRGDAAYLKRFMMEEWIARRINSAHVVKPRPRTRKPRYLYVVTEYIEGQTLTQWMADNPTPELERVRHIAEQIGRGLQAFHRMEMLHQDLRPDNVMIDASGTVKIIDFGSTEVAGVTEAAPVKESAILGTRQYTAPEYFLGEGGSPRSDVYSLGVIVYQMLTGRLPYGLRAAQATTRAQQRKLRYRSALNDEAAIPAWVDWAVRKAVHPDPAQRYGELSQFLFELRRPGEEFAHAKKAPLIERNPLLFWKCISFALLVLVLFLMSRLSGR